MSTFDPAGFPRFMSRTLAFALWQYQVSEREQPALGRAATAGEAAQIHTRWKGQEEAYRVNISASAHPKQKKERNK